MNVELEVNKYSVDQKFRTSKGWSDALKSQFIASETVFSLMWTGNNLPPPQKTIYTPHKMCN